MTRRLVPLGALVIASVALPAQAHVIGHAGAGFSPGFAHPFLGLDHLLIAAAVGLFASTRDGRAQLLVPMAFALAMLFGFALGAIGPALPVLALTGAAVLLVGLVLALSPRLSATGGVGIAALAAIAHGHPHGGELLLAASPAGYGLGLLLGSLLVVGVAMALGLAARRFGPLPARAGGAALAAAGLVLLVL